MDMLELARELGQLIKESEQMGRMNLAEEAYHADIELCSLIDEYNTQDKALGETGDEVFIEAIEARMKEIYDQVIGNPVYIEYMQAQKDVQKLMNTVNSEINFVVTGHRGCSEDGCSGCSGCGEH